MWFYRHRSVRDFSLAVGGWQQCRATWLNLYDLEETELVWEDACAKESVSISSSSMLRETKYQGTLAHYTHFHWRCQRGCSPRGWERWMIFNEGHAVMSGAGTLLPGHAVNGASILADEPEPFTASWWQMKFPVGSLWIIHKGNWKTTCS